jgi:antitoxin (DNA-binding transcriptional repressor) of toxin-antitoxin stability system
MRTATVRQLQHNLKDVMHWVDFGEEVQITRRSQVIARMIPDRPIPKAIKWPDFAKRVQSVFKKNRGKTLTEILLEGREDR